ncbi:DUF4258 domain-containing protein [Flavobacteriaceae bacterium GSB9]|nr:DUF4258 domain-containing protein [Flavobacteriaceae bacterium GSB9]
MKLIQRIGYYLGGFAIGLVVLAFFLSGKKTSCSYGPEARVIKNISTKKLAYSKAVNSAIEINNIDSVEIRKILKTGDINFSKSNPRQEPCGLYLIESELNNTAVYLTVENCDSIATIQTIEIK